VNPSPDETALSSVPTITLTSTRLGAPGHCGGTVTLQLAAGAGAQELTCASTVPNRISVGSELGGTVRFDPETTT
jgi:hypothetical protein